MSEPRDQTNVERAVERWLADPKVKAALHRHDTQRTGWQPIETATRDKRVLLYNGYWGAYTAEYDGAHWPTWNSDGGPYYPVPTHWMPLPEPLK